MASSNKSTCVSSYDYKQKSMYIQYTLAFQYPRMINEINMWTYMLNRCPFWHHHRILFIESVMPPGPPKCVMFGCFFEYACFFSTSLIYLSICLYIRYFYCLDLVVSTSKNWSTALSQGMQAVVVAKVISKVKASQDSGFVPAFSNVNQYMNHRSHKWITNMWGQILVALPSLVIKC